MWTCPLGGTCMSFKEVFMSFKDEERGISRHFLAGVGES